jgi:hypothetical protein
MLDLKWDLNQKTNVPIRDRRGKQKHKKYRGDVKMENWNNVATSHGMPAAIRSLKEARNKLSTGSFGGHPALLTP